MFGRWIFGVGKFSELFDSNVGTVVLIVSGVVLLGSVMVAVMIKLL